MESAGDDSGVKWRAPLHKGALVIAVLGILLFVAFGLRFLWPMPTDPPASCPTIDAPWEGGKPPAHDGYTLRERLETDPWECDNGGHAHVWVCLSPYLVYWELKRHSLCTPSSDTLKDITF